jgi:hypothetical protein
MPVAFDPREMQMSDLTLQSRSKGVAATLGPMCTSHPRHRLSPVDRRWGLESKQPGDPWEPVPFNMKLAWRYQGRLHHELLQRAAERVADRHDILGCTLEFIDGGWRFRADRTPSILVRELEVPGANHREADALRAIGEHIHREFDFALEGPLRIGHAQVGEDDYIIGVAIHHSFADAYSKRILSFELAAFYDSPGMGVELEFASRPLSYLEYLLSVQEWSRGAHAQEVLEFWMGRLRRAVPLRQMRAEELSGASFRLPQELSDRVRQLCATIGIGAHVFWEAVHQVALRQLLETEDVVTLSVDGGRRQAELTGAFGQFINLYPCRSRLSSHLTFVEVMERLRAGNRESAPYRVIPYDLIADRCPFEYAASFGHLNFIPRQFFALPTFGSLCSVEGPPGTRARLIYPYAISVRDEPQFQVACGGHIREPFSPQDLSSSLERVAVACVADPNRQLSSIAP